MAFQDANEIMSIFAEDVDLGRYAAQEYLGAHYRHAWNSYNQKVPDVLKSASEFLNEIGKSSGKNIFCENPQSKGDLVCDPQRHLCPIRVEHEREGDNAPVKFIFCNDWFKKPPLRDLIPQSQECLKNAGNDTVLLERVFDMRYYDNTALWLIHAFFHTRKVTKVMTADKAYDPEPPLSLFPAFPNHDYVKSDTSNDEFVPVLTPWEAKKLALNQPGSDWLKPGPLGSATNYALFALSTYVERQLGGYPDQPWSETEANSGFRTEKIC